MKIGTFQLTDLFFNTLGGMLGGVIYWGFEDRKRIVFRREISRLGCYPVEKCRTEGADVENAETVKVVKRASGRGDCAGMFGTKICCNRKLVGEAGQKMLKARPGEENIHKKEDLQISARIMIQRSRFRSRSG